MDDIKKILESYKEGSLDLETAMDQVNNSYFSDLGHTVLDNNRKNRNGYPEVIYCAGKTAEQVKKIFGAMAERGDNILGTRAGIDLYEFLKPEYPGIEYNEDARIITLKNHEFPVSEKHTIAVITAGTSDIPVAEEAAVTAEFYGNKVLRINDVGVAGIHRLLNRLETIRTARVLVVVAGMEGALPSAVGGLVDKPIIAVPTSVGYGASFGGLAALLGMLNSCSSGISVVNIDNGFGAGYLASMINRL
ncbi:MAG: nickel pincer cofactor biosynthesis protein LarB [Spirochaetaceae bacterium]|jgi:NCAIR mutase (PurE)-related protein|nr:nickel pincer cofactor biosynthesis protein LarB [Spirochaetaceae bacterium]